MSVKEFTDDEVIKLKENPYVKNVSNKGITYTEEFKRVFIEKYEQGSIPSIIFTECGFDIRVLGKDRYQSAGKRWRAAYNKNGELGLADLRKENSGRPCERELSTEEKYERLKTKIHLLQAENELLKKSKWQKGC